MHALEATALLLAGALMCADSMAKTTSTMCQGGISPAAWICAVSIQQGVADFLCLGTAVQAIRLGTNLRFVIFMLAPLYAACISTLFRRWIQSGEYQASALCSAEGPSLTLQKMSAVCLATFTLIALVGTSQNNAWKRVLLSRLGRLNVILGGSARSPLRPHILGLSCFGYTCTMGAALFFNVVVRNDGSKCSARGLGTGPLFML